MGPYEREFFDMLVMLKKNGFEAGAQERDHLALIAAKALKERNVPLTPNMELVIARNLAKEEMERIHEDSPRGVENNKKGGL